MPPRPRAPTGATPARRARTPPAPSSFRPRPTTRGRGHEVATEGRPDLGAPVLGAPTSAGTPRARRAHATAWARQVRVGSGGSVKPPSSLALNARNPLSRGSGSGSGGLEAGACPRRAAARRIEVEEGQVVEVHVGAGSWSSVSGATGSACRAASCGVSGVERKRGRSGLHRAPRARRSASASVSSSCSGSGSGGGPSTTMRRARYPRPTSSARPGPQSSPRDRPGRAGGRPPTRTTAAPRPQSLDMRRTDGGTIPGQTVCNPTTRGGRAFGVTVPGAAGSTTRRWSSPGTSSESRRG